MLVLALMLPRFGMTCLPTFALLDHWCHSGAYSRHIFLERPIPFSYLHILVFSVLQTLLCPWFMVLDKAYCSKSLRSCFTEISSITVILELHTSGIQEWKIFKYFLIISRLLGVEWSGRWLVVIYMSKFQVRFCMMCTLQSMQPGNMSSHFTFHTP